MEGGLPGLSLFGGNENDSIGCPRSVDGSRSGVFQDIDGLDIGGVETVDIAADHVVNDVQWLRVADGADTTDVDFEPFAGHSRCLGDLHTRRLALQRVGYARGA